MKHFRDLVLSTKEPAVKNVLWIKPIDIQKYLVLMYEDGWIPLFGGSSGESNGLSYTVLDRTPDGYIVQFTDITDPDNVKNLYPKTKAVQVWLSNNVNVEEAINNINNKLNSISQLIKKANFVTLTLLNNDLSKKGNTYWVYNSYTESTGEYAGEAFLRKYTSASAYITISLSTADILMRLKPVSAELAYVSSMVMSGNGTIANVQLVATKKDVTTLINSLMNSIISDIQVDGESVVTNNIANIRNRVRNVYLVEDDIFASDYAEGSDRANKTFLVRAEAGQLDLTKLYKYDSTGLNTNREEINLVTGDILFNLDEHTINNSDFIPYTLYVYDKPQLNVKVHPLGTKELVENWVSSMIGDAVESVENIYIDFTASNEQTASTGMRSWNVTTTSTVSYIQSEFSMSRNVYARLTGIENANYDLVPTLLPLRLCNSGFTLFSAYGYNKGYELDGHGTDPVSWKLREIPILIKLTFDDAPTDGSNNPVTSDGIYEALLADDNRYVLLNTTRTNQPTSYSERLESTPKFHRVEFLDTGSDVDGEYDVWTANGDGGEGVITDSSTDYGGGGTGKALGRFQSLWWAVMECNDTTGQAGALLDLVPKLILRLGNVACYCTSDLLNRDAYSSNLIPDPTLIILKFFDGTNIITYQLDVQGASTTPNPDYPGETVIHVLKTVQAI